MTYFQISTNFIEEIQEYYSLSKVLRKHQIHTHYFIVKILKWVTLITNLLDYHERTRPLNKNKKMWYTNVQMSLFLCD